MESLDLYGRLTGEYLAESEDECPPDIESAETAVQGAAERRPLFGRCRIPRNAPPGDTSDAKAFFMLLKAFMGTGIIFLPKAFCNGGIQFSFIALVMVSIMTTVCFHLLLQCRRQCGGGYGDIGERISGPYLRSLILVSITISQLGFVSAGIVFTAENLHSLSFWKRQTWGLRENHLSG